VIEIKWTRDREVSGTYYGWDESGEVVAAIRRQSANDWRVEVSGKRQIFRGNLLRQAKTIARRVLSDLEPEPTPNPFEQDELPEVDEQATQTEQTSAERGDLTGETFDEQPAVEVEPEVEPEVKVEAEPEVEPEVEAKVEERSTGQAHTDDPRGPETGTGTPRHPSRHVPPSTSPHPSWDTVPHGSRLPVEGDRLARPAL
jgi:hypothetical protein